MMEEKVEKNVSNIPLTIDKSNIIHLTIPFYPIITNNIIKFNYSYPNNIRKIIYTSGITNDISSTSNIIYASICAECSYDPSSEMVGELHPLYWPNLPYSQN